MGCGGHRDILFDLFDSCERPRRRGYGSGYDSHDSDRNYSNNDHYHDYRQNDFEEKMNLLKKMYAEGIIDDAEYQSFKQGISENNIGFEGLMEIRTSRLNNRSHQTEKNRNVNNSASENEYEDTLTKLKQTKQKISEMQEKLMEEIQSLQREKEKMDALAETILKASEDKAETFIRKKLDIEENIQSIEKRTNELQKQIDDIDNMIKTVNTKKLMFETLKLQEEVANMKLKLEE